MRAGRFMPDYKRNCCESILKIGHCSDLFLDFPLEKRVSVSKLRQKQKIMVILGKLHAFSVDFGSRKPCNSRLIRSLTGRLYSLILKKWTFHSRSSKLSHCFSDRKVSQNDASAIYSLDNRWPDLHFFFSFKCQSVNSLQFWKGH